jgi:large subunit ribosomal protein L10
VNRSQKSAIIEQLKAQAEAASFSVVTDFKGLSVEELTRLRIAVRESGNEYYVVKNTLARIAFSGSAHESIRDLFKENCAVAFGASDPVALAKVISAFAKSNKKLIIKHGCLDGKPLSGKDVEMLAVMPSKPELIARALGTMNAVPTNFVCLFANILRGLLYALKAIETKKAAA